MERTASASNRRSLMMPSQTISYPKPPAMVSGHKKTGSNNDDSASFGLVRSDSGLKTTRKTLIAQKLRKFLSNRPTQEDLYQRGYLQGNPYPILPNKLAIFYKLQQAFDKANGYQTEGVFRVSGNSVNIRNIWNSFVADSPNFQGASAHDIAGVMKLYVRQLQAPLVPFELFQYLIDAQKNEDVAKRHQQMKPLLRLIPEDCMLMLKALTVFLEKVSLMSPVNKMTAHNISVCFGPNVLKSPKDGAEVLSDIEVQCKVVETFIVHRAELFGDAPGAVSAAPVSVLPPPPSNLPPPPSNFPPPLSNLPPPPSTLPFPGAGKLPPPFTMLPPPPSLVTPPPSLVTPPPLNVAVSPPRARQHRLMTISGTSSRPPMYSISPRQDDEFFTEEVFLELIDDLATIEKPVLLKKLATYFAPDRREGFTKFLRDVVGVDGVIALLELVVM